MAPRDAASGLPTGKRQHKPIVIRKELDKSTPLLAKALSSNEAIKSIVLEFWRPTSDGKVEVYYTVKLKDCLITSIQSAGSGSDRPMESLTLNFTKVEFENKSSQKQDADAWKKPERGGS
jgi:type VI secretion system secreted protein Hcp